MFYLMVGMYEHLQTEGKYINFKYQAISNVTNSREPVLYTKGTDMNAHLFFFAAKRT